MVNVTDFSKAKRIVSNGQIYKLVKRYIVEELKPEKLKNS